MFLLGKVERFKIKGVPKIPEELKFISPSPKLALALSKRERTLLPKPLYDYLVDWVEEVGTLMRTKEYMVGFVASAASTGVLLVAAKYLPITRRLGIISEALGIAE